MSDLNYIKKKFEENFVKVNSKNDLQNLKTEYFGKNGIISKELNESDKKKIKKILKFKSVKDIVRIFSQEKNISKSKIYNYCLQIKNEN